MRGAQLWDTGFIEGRPSTFSNPPYEEMWKKILANAIRPLPKLEGTAFSMEIDFHIGTDRIASRRRNDVDNLAKVVLDTMNEERKLSDDTLVFDLRVTKHPTSREGARVRVWSWSPNRK